MKTESFYKNVSKETDAPCWRWIGSITPVTGYGRVKFNGKRVGAHRASYIIHKGEIPEGLCVCHTCDNRWCVNPDHLWLGTDAENCDDKISKGRHTIGEINGTNKLSVDDILAIRRIYLGGSITQKQIAEKYNVHKSTIQLIVRRKRWSHI